MSRPEIRVLVTGAAGFIGSHMAARLALRGHRVLGCDNFNSYYAPALKRARVESMLAPQRVECAQADLADARQTVSLFDAWRPTHVVHLAAQAGVRYSISHPDSYIQSNVVAFSHVIESCRTYHVRHLVYASSSSVYGAHPRTPFHEEDRTDEPLSLYAATKKSNELMAYCASHLHGLPATGVRFFTVYGPWGRPDMAYYRFTESMLRGEPILVFGRGALYRDFTYVDDIVEGVERLLFKPSPPHDGQPPHAVFNIGNHRAVRVLDFIATLERVLGVRAEMDFLPMQPGDVPATCADTARLREWVGFAPSTALEDGLERFCAWYRWWKARSANDARTSSAPPASA